MPLTKLPTSFFLVLPQVLPSSRADMRIELPKDWLAEEDVGTLILRPALVSVPSAEV